MDGPDRAYLFYFDSPGHQHLKALGIARAHHDSDCARSGHGLMLRAIAPDQHTLIVRDAEVNRNDRSLTGAAEFPRPLV